MNELKITKERVLEAASKCSDAKRTLETLFPEAFNSNDEFEIKNLKAYKNYHYQEELDSIEVTHGKILIPIPNANDLWANDAMRLAIEISEKLGYYYHGAESDGTKLVLRKV